MSLQLLLFIISAVAAPVITQNECNNYKTLSSPDRAQRAVSLVNAEICDRYRFSSGWYRFTGDAGDKMATSCVPIQRCMTAATGWLNGLHPIDSTIVTREVCFNWKKDCCNIRINIRVKLCSGFYIYELPTAPYCNLRYCGNAVGKMKNPSKCGGNLTSLSGQITSPGYPNYMEPITCHWTIKAPFEGNILLYFENITLGHGGCFSNNLTVEGEKTETFCHRKDLNAFSILVAKRTVNIYYKSVYWNKKLGFKLKYLMLKENLENAQVHSQWNIITQVNGSSSIHVSWKAFENSFINPSQTLYGLVVVCKPLTLVQRTMHVVVQQSATDVKVTGLTGGIEYKVQVVALLKNPNTGSVSMYGSDTSTVTTKKGECEIYKNLTSQKRSESEPGGPYCDQQQIYTPYWYRFEGDAGTHIATSCVPQHKCHTSSPGWMDGKHPHVQDGVVMRTVCFHGLEDCCRWEVTIRVRNCGSFYVYQLHYPPVCKLGYCGSSTEIVLPEKPDPPKRTTETEKEPSKNGKPKIYIIIGASVGGVVLLVIVLLLVRRCLKKNRTQEKNVRPSPGTSNQSCDGVGKGDGEAIESRPVSADVGNEDIQCGTDNSEIPAKPGAEIPEKPGEDEKCSEA